MHVCERQGMYDNESHMYFPFPASVVIDWCKTFYFWLLRVRKRNNPFDEDWDKRRRGRTSSFCFCLDYADLLALAAWPVDHMHWTQRYARAQPWSSSSCCGLHTLKTSSDGTSLLGPRDFVVLTSDWIIGSDGEFFLSKWSNSHNTWIDLSSPAGLLGGQQYLCGFQRGLVWSDIISVRKHAFMCFRDRTAHLRNRRLLMADSCIHAEIDN